VRPDQTDPGINPITREHVTTRDVPIRSDARTERTGAPLDGTVREVPARTDTADGIALPRRERAGSPSPTALEGASSWQDIKSRFVDDPAGAIAAAEELVRLAMERRVRALKDEMTALCARGSDEESSATEGLRTRLLRYQQYCEQLAGSTLH
jgi:hypothetical protein